LCYYQLAQALGREQRFYGLQAPGLESEGASFSSLEQLASCYLDALQALQPEDPYFLGGWSLERSVSTACKLLSKLRTGCHRHPWQFF